MNCGEYITWLMRLKGREVNVSRADARPWLEAGLKPEWIREYRKREQERRHG